MTKIRTALVALIACALCIGTIQVSTTSEHAELQRLLYELHALEAIVASAERSAQPDTRIRFRYDWLRHDLNKVKRGIEDYLIGPYTEPQTFEPLRGDYRR